MKKKTLARIVGFLTLCAAPAFAQATPPLDFSTAYDAAESQMLNVIGGIMVLVALGAAVSYGIKMWKRLKSAV